MWLYLQLQKLYIDDTRELAVAEFYPLKKMKEIAQLLYAVPNGHTTDILLA